MRKANMSKQPKPSSEITQSIARERKKAFAKHASHSMTSTNQPWQLLFDSLSKFSKDFMLNRAQPEQSSREVD